MSDPVYYSPSVTWITDKQMLESMICF